MNNQAVSSETPDELLPDPVVKVIGIGGCGINAINRMIENGIQGVEFIAIACDMLELARSKTDHRLHLVSAERLFPFSTLIVTISEDDQKHINALIAGADIVFIVAGMGAGTGTSVAPIVAKIARDLNILSIAVVSMPFLYEGSHTRRADQGIKELSEHADALVIIPNGMLLTGEECRVSEVLTAANNLMHLAVSGIAESVSDNNLICIDVTDLRMIFADAGMVTMGTAIASGLDRAKAAYEQAISKLFPVTINLADAQYLLINITSSSSLKLSEVEAVMEYCNFTANKATIIAAAVVDETMKNDLRLTLFAARVGDRVPAKVDDRTSAIPAL